MRKLVVFSSGLRWFLLSICLLTVVASGLALRVPHVRAQGDVLLDDQFQDNSNSWELAGKKNSKLTVSDGVMSLQVAKENLASWATPDRTFPDDIDVQVEVSVPNPPGGGDWTAAVILRADARSVDSAFYQFEVTGGGKWGFVTRTAKGDEYKVQKSGILKDWDPTASNTLKISASGTTFTFLVNNTQVGTFDDDTINNDPGTEKYVGLLATTLKGASSLTVEFRNLQISTAGEQQPTATLTPVKAQRTPTRVPTKANRTPTKTTKATPTATPIPPAGGDVLLEETFPPDNPSGWKATKATDSNVTISNNTLIIDVTKKSWIRWSLPEALTFPNDIDATVTVTVPTPDPSGDWSYGIGVRDYVQNKVEFGYLLEITGAKQWVFSRVNGSKGLETVVHVTQIPAEANINIKGKNTVRVTAVGGHFEFFMNDVKIGEGDDDVLTPPDQTNIFLAAGTYSKANNVRAVFSDLVVKSASN